jgi:hypothetical protein
MEMKTAILTPVHGSPRALYTQSLGNMLLRTARDRPDIEILYRIAEGHLIQNRNFLARTAIEWGADYCLWIDADMKFPDGALIALAAHELPMVAANCPTRSTPPCPTAGANGKPVYSPAGATGLVPVDFIGLGLTMIRTSVLKDLGTPLFAADPSQDKWPGEDMHLCRRIRAAGIPIHIDHDLSQHIGHVVEHVYTNDIAARLGAARPGISPPPAPKPAPPAV